MTYYPPQFMAQKFRPRTVRVAGVCSTMSRALTGRDEGWGWDDLKTHPLARLTWMLTIH